ncbi:MAG: serine/threonine-protein kinase [Nocardiopsaceae bacterium]|nr:serine/threonine-protein kinase [Nocardiopsaceae bacterium]
MTSGNDAGGTPLPPELRPLTDKDPRRIGPYRVVGRLGEGGMGAVYGALDDQDRCIAVKVVHERFAEDAEFRTAFAREVQLMRQVGGVCAAAVHAADTEAARPWVATDFIPGPTLRRHVDEHGPVAPEMLFAFAAGTAEALASVHAAGIVHCDVKPGNVILSPDGPKVLDFGIARPVAATDPTGAVFGSPGWLSPERYRGEAPTPAADVFAWGGLVAFAATGRTPFGRGDTAELRRRTLEEDPDLDGLAPELLPLIQSAMAKDPSARPTAESAYRGIIAFTAPDDTSGIATVDLAQRLRGLITHHWRGIDVSWHNPALWLAAAPFIGAAGGTALAAGTGAAGGAAAAGAAGAAGTAGASTASAGIAGGAAAGGTATASTAAAVGGGAVAGGAGTAKVAAIVTSAVVATAAVGTGGYYAAEALSDEGAPQAQASPSPSPSPSLGPPEDIVADIITLIESADSYRASHTTVVEGGNVPGTEEFAFSSEGEPVYQWFTGGNSTAGGTDRLYREDQDLLLIREWGATVPEDHYMQSPGPSEEEAAGFSREPVLAPFQELSASMEVTDRTEDEVDGVAATLITGTFDHVDERTGTEYPGIDFQLWVDAGGTPVRLSYQTDTGEHSWLYSDIGGGLNGRNCGAVDGVHTVGEALVVPLNRDLTCEEVVPVVEEYLAMPDDQKEGTGYLAEIDGWTCGVPTAAEIGARSSEDVATCRTDEAETTSGRRVDLLRLD